MNMYIYIDADTLKSKTSGQKKVENTFLSCSSGRDNFF